MEFTFIFFLTGKSMKRLLTLLFIPLILIGCKTPQQIHYVQVSDIKTLAGAKPLSEDEVPKIIISSPEKLKYDLVTAYTQNYIELGKAVFTQRNIAKQNESDLVKQAKNVGAKLVIAYSVYKGRDYYNSTKDVETGSEISETITTLPSGKTITTTNTVKIYTSVPVKVYYDEYVHYSGFFALMSESQRFVYLNDLTDEKKKNLGINGGAIVSFAHPESPYYIGGVRDDDVILKINVEEVQNATQASMVLQFLRAGNKPCVLIVLRDGKQLTLKMQFNEPIKSS